MPDIGKGIFGILTAIVGVAIIAVIVSRNSNTTGVISSASDAFTSALRVAVSPIVVSN